MCLCFVSAHAGPPVRGNSIFGKCSVLGRVRDEKALTVHMKGLQRRQPLQRDEPVLWVVGEMIPCDPLAHGKLI